MSAPGNQLHLYPHQRRAALAFGPVWTVADELRADGRDHPMCRCTIGDLVPLKKLRPGR